MLRKITYVFAAMAILSGQALAQTPPGYTMERTGSADDFAYFEGAWTTQQHRLRTRGVGANDWEDFPATQCMTRYMAGTSTVDELYFPTRGTSALTVRLFDPEARQWSIYFISSVSGRLDPIPVVGGFEGNRGEFYAQDQVGGRPVKVRYLWTIQDQNHARWEQALSYDDATWETNWIADFTRGDTHELCERGQPRR